MRNLVLFLLAGVLFSGCASSDSSFRKQSSAWVPPQTQEFDYFSYQASSPSSLSGHQRRFTFYVFDSGYIFYFGGERLKKSGWHRIYAGPEVFADLQKVLTRYDFQGLAPSYGSEDDTCGEVWATFHSGLFFEYQQDGILKKVWWDNGCIEAPDHDRVLGMARAIRQAVPLENYVGADKYTWDYDEEFENVILKEDGE